uniref:Secreted protein n=1 Tax=Panagrellus redivivus TaxID=6233 RepID=A0A7E4UQ02_PANRE
MRLIGFILLFAFATPVLAFPWTKYYYTRIIADVYCKDVPVLARVEVIEADDYEAAHDHIGTFTTAPNNMDNHLNILIRGSEDETWRNKKPEFFLRINLVPLSTTPTKSALSTPSRTSNDLPPGSSTIATPNSDQPLDPPTKIAFSTSNSRSFPPDEPTRGPKIKLSFKRAKTSVRQNAFLHRSKKQFGSLPIRIQSLEKQQDFLIAVDNFLP